MHQSFQAILLINLLIYFWLSTISIYNKYAEKNTNKCYNENSIEKLINWCIFYLCIDETVNKEIKLLITCRSKDCTIYCYFQDC